MKLDQTLPESTKQTDAEISLLKAIRKILEAARTGRDVDKCEAALREIRRCDTRLEALTRNKQRINKRKEKEQVAA